MLPLLSNLVPYTIKQHPHIFAFTIQPSRCLRKQVLAWLLYTHCYYHVVACFLHRMSFRCIHRMVRYGGGYSAGRVWVKCVFSAVRGYLFVLFGALYSQCIPELHWSRMVASLNLIRIKSLKRWGNPIIHSRSPWLNCLVSWSLSAARRNILTCCLSNINGSIWWKADRGERRGAGQVMLFNTIDPAGTLG